MDIVYIILKFVSLACTGVFAVIGISTDYKKEGKRTTWGQVAVIGVIISSIFSISILALEQRSSALARARSDQEKLAAQVDANNKFMESVKRLEQIRTAEELTVKETSRTARQTEIVSDDLKVSLSEQANIMSKTRTISTGTEKALNQQREILGQQFAIAATTRRLTRPIGAMRLDMELEYDLNDPIFATYVARLRLFADLYMQRADSKKSSVYPGEDFIIFLEPEAGHSLSRIAISPRSPLLPRRGREEGAAHETLSVFLAQVLINPVDSRPLESVLRDERTRARKGITLNAFASSAHLEQNGASWRIPKEYSIHLVVDFKEGKIGQAIKGMPLEEDPSNHEIEDLRDGNYTYIDDLKGKQIIFDLSGYSPDKVPSIRRWKLSYGQSEAIRQYIKLGGEVFNCALLDSPATGSRTLVMQHKFSETELGN